MKKSFDAAFLSSFCMELHLVLHAGLPLGEGVAMLAGGCDRKSAAVLTDMAERLDAGAELHAALRESGVFPSYMTDMLEIGGRAGRLDTVLQALSGYYERQEQLVAGLRAAVIYPAVLLLMLFFVFFILITQVLPVFSEVFSQLGGSLSGPALLSLRFGVWLAGHWIPVALVLIVLAAAAALLWKSGRVRALMERCGLFPRLSATVAAARFAEAMSLTMKSGLDADESMDLARRLVGNAAMNRKLSASRVRLADGESFAEVLREENVFPALYCRMLAVGFKTGAADTVMAEIARRASEKAQNDIERLAGRVEPSLVIFMSLLVGLILLSVMLPLLGIMSGLG